MTGVQDEYQRHGEGDHEWMPASDKALFSYGYRQVASVPIRPDQEEGRPSRRSPRTGPWLPAGYRQNL